MKILKDFTGHGAGSSSFGDIKEQANLALGMNDLLCEALKVMQGEASAERETIIKKIEAHFSVISKP